MKTWEVLFLAWSCLADGRLPLIGLSIRPLPEELRPAAAAVALAGAGPLCRARPEIERHPSRAAAERRIKVLGQVAAPRLRYCERFRCWDREVRWTDRLVVDGKEVK
jgi:hypothetical protein